jgi:sarcosine oxidase
VSFDVLVVGLGVVGSAVVRSAARAGMSVLGVDRFGPVDPRRSSWGESRMLRLAYPEGETYARLACRARDLWRALEASSDERLFFETGGLVVGPAESGLSSLYIRTAAAQEVEHEVLTAAELASSFPTLKVCETDRAYFEPGAGVLHAEACVRALQRDAVRAGAELRFDTVVPPSSLQPWSGDIELEGARVSAKQLVVAAGA